MAQIDILLASYNGADYIAQQLRSLQNQTFTDWRLIVHDDGSTDSTPDIVKRFQTADPRVCLVEDGVRLGSAAANFMYLLKYAEAPFCAFCDQDDIWLEDKLLRMHETIARLDQGKPQMVWSNSYVYSMDTGDISGYATLLIPTNLRDQLFANSGIQGCALMFNEPLRRLCADAPEFIAMHDHLFTLGAVTFGELHSVPRRLMLYRRHRAAVTGATYKSRTEHLRHFFAPGKTVIDGKHLKAIRSFYDKYEPLMSDEARRTFLDFFKFSNEGKLKSLIHALRGNYRLFGKRHILLAKILLRKMC